jgi:uncharacterized protein YdhG (YjbR/CyaY superfamily)
MTYEAGSPEEYIAQVPEERKEAMHKLRNTILENLPEGFEETMQYGMIGYVVPHSSYPDGYHCDPKIPLPFMSLASQKNYIALYHSGIYVQPDLAKWFQAAYAEKDIGKLDMGKSCIRLKKPAMIPYDLIADLCGKITVSEWIQTYEQAIKKTSKN